nr:hypothetical protein [Actinoplanes sp. TBRC 11911]
MTIWPLSQGEIAGVTEDFLPALRTLCHRATASLGKDPARASHGSAKGSCHRFRGGCSAHARFSCPARHTARLHWRTHDGEEVGFVIEFDDGGVLAFEVKANERVAGADLKGLRALRDALGDRFIAGAALSTGLRSYTYEDRIHIMPVDRLWTHVGSG